MWNRQNVLLRYILGLSLILIFQVSARAQCGCTNCPVDLPDDLNTPFQANIEVSNSGNDILGVNNLLEQVCVDITHTWVGDLDITLTAPDGTSVILYADGNSDAALGGSETSPFGNSENDMNICFTPPGSTINIFGFGTGQPCTDQDYENPCNGNVPGEPCYVGNWGTWDEGCLGGIGLNNFNNGTGTVSGTWVLTINDNAGGDAGQINDVTLIFTNEADSCSTTPDPPDPPIPGVCQNITTIPIPDSGPPTATSTISNSGSAGNLGADTELLSVCMLIEHTFIGDLDVSLIAPNGSSIELSSDNGGGDNDYGDVSGFQEMCFTSTSTNPITGYNGGDLGDYAPEQPFSGLTGSPNGIWTLEVLDDFVIDNGSILSWSLTMDNGDCSASCDVFSSFTDDFCAGTSYDFNGTTLNIAGTYIDTISLGTGCDSIVELTLRESPPYMVPINIWQCDSIGLGVFIDTFVAVNGCDSIVGTRIRQWPNYELTTNFTTCDPSQVGITVDSLQTVNGCDSILITNTTLIPEITFSVNLTSCDPNTAGTSVDTFPSSLGCDSIVTVITSLIPSYDDTIRQTTCDPNRAGTYYDSLSTIAGCDSITTTIIDLIPEVNFTVNATSCDPLQVGTFVDTLASFGGCDSIVTTITTLIPSYDDTIQLTTCDPNVAGIYYDSLNTSDGCDSITTSIYTLIPEVTFTVNATSCDPTLVGSVVDTLGTFAGCDSIVTTITTLIPSYDDTIQLATCDPNIAGIYFDSLSTLEGCDSITTTIYTLIPEVTFTVNTTSCDAMQVGSVVDTLGSFAGCDSIVTTVTTLLPSYDDTLELTTCDPNVAGTYYDSLSTLSGCDSITTTIYTLFFPAYDTLFLTTCDPLLAGIEVDSAFTFEGCDSVVWTQTDLLPSSTDTLFENTCDPALAGEVTDSFTNTFGCDSVVTIVTSLLTRHDELVTQTTCIPAMSGTMVDSFQNVFGCDSIVTTVTTLLPSSADTIVIFSCSVADTGTITEYLTNTAGCDSLVTTVTILWPSSIDSIIVSTCDALQAGIVTDTFPNIFGCDSIVTTTTMWVDVIVDSTFQTTCDPALAITETDIFTAYTGCDSISVVVTELLPTGSMTVQVSTCDPVLVGVENDTLVNSFGCDSLVTTITVLVESYDDTINLTSCNPLDTGTVVQPLVSVSGCDSIITTITTLLPSYDIHIIDSSCVIADTGISVQNLTTQAGCDSVITTSVSLIDAQRVSISESICLGDSLTIDGVDFYTSTGIYTDTLPGSVCDSIITLTLSVDQPPSPLPPVSICPGSSFTVGGTQFADSTAGIYQVDLPGTNCEPVITQTVIVQPYAFVQLDTLICSGSAVTINGQDFYSTSGLYRDTIPGYTCDSIVELTLGVITTGTQTINLTSCDPSEVGTVNTIIPNYLGCDSTITTITTLVSVNIGQLDVTDANCSGVNGAVAVTMNSGNPPYTYDISGTGSGTALAGNQTIAPLDAGSYQIVITDRDGCMDTAFFFIEAADSTIDFEVFPDFASIQLGESVDFEASPATGDIQWNPPLFLSCDTCAFVTATPEYSTYYSVIRNDGGCLGYDTVFVEVNEPAVLVPSAFTPDGDGHNDIFHIMDKNIVEFYYLEVYNRWGELLFQTTSLDFGWDGSYKNEIQEMDTYLYHLKVRLYTGKEVEKEGAFILLR